jgi:hypothetical protein
MRKLFRFVSVTVFEREVGGRRFHPVTAFRSEQNPARTSGINRFHSCSIHIYTLVLQTWFVE